MSSRVQLLEDVKPLQLLLFLQKADVYSYTALCVMPATTAERVCVVVTDEQGI